MKKYIFIDFDGVLNTERHHGALVTAGKKTTDEFGPCFDPESVANLGKIVDETGAVIVICSSWKMEGVDRMKELWKIRKMPGVLAGCTPDYIPGMDIREHGYTGGKLIDVIEKYGIAGNIDVLIAEGTNLGQADKKVMPEADVQKEMLQVMKRYKNVFVLSSSADADRLESIWSANKRMTYRPFVCDDYQKQVMAAIAGARAGMGKYYQFNDDKVYPYRRENEKLVNWMKKTGFTMMIRYSDKFHRYLDEILSWCKPEETCLIYSQFKGYILPEHEAFNGKLKAFVNQFPHFEYAHTSGHASKETLEKVCEAVNPKSAIIPIHKNAGADFKALNISDRLKTKVVGQTISTDGIDIAIC